MLRRDKLAAKLAKMDFSFDEDEDLSNDDEVLNITPTSIIDAADIAEGELMPVKSRQRYERTYKEFQKQRAAKKTRSSSERMLLAYLGELANQQKKKPSTLWSYYSMLRCTLNLNEKVDISTYPKLLKFLNRKNDGYQPVKAKTFTEAEMHKFISEASDYEWLVVKVSMTHFDYHIISIYC